MKKHLKTVLICIVISIIVAVMIFKLWESGAFIFVRSADVGTEYVTWNGKKYSQISGDYTEGRTIAKGKTGDWVINMVEEDPLYTFIVARSFLDDHLWVAVDYTVPTSGKLTTVSWNGTYIEDEVFLAAMENIESEKTTTFTYETDGIYQLTESQHMRSLYFAYENCPVTTNFKGYMGKVNGEWVITTYISADVRNEDGSPKPYSVSCYKIPSEYWDAISEYFG